MGNLLASMMLYSRKCGKAKTSFPFSVLKPLLANMGQLCCFPFVVRETLQAKIKPTALEKCNKVALNSDSSV